MRMALLRCGQPTAGSKVHTSFLCGRWGVGQVCDAVIGAASGEGDCGAGPVTGACGQWAAGRDWQKQGSSGGGKDEAKREGVWPALSSAAASGRWWR